MAESILSTPTVRVLGRGVVKAVPESYLVQYRLSVTENTAAGAAKELAALRERVGKAFDDGQSVFYPTSVGYSFLRAVVGAPDDTTEDGGPTRRGRPAAKTAARRVAEYTLAENFTYVVSRDGDVPGLIARLEKAGTSVERVEALIDEPAARAAALRGAAADARDRAALLLTYADATLGDVLQAADESTQLEGRFGGRTQSSPHFDVCGLHFPCGPVTVTAYATFTFAILPGGRAEPKRPDPPGQEPLPGINDPVESGEGQP